MIRFPDLTRRTLAFALAGGAILFLAGFSYGYAAPCDERGEAGLRLTFAE
jgi:hypothetical protein